MIHGQVFFELLYRAVVVCNKISPSLDTDKFIGMHVVLLFLPVDLIKARAKRTASDVVTWTIYLAFICLF